MLAALASDGPTGVPGCVTCRRGRNKLTAQCQAFRGTLGAKMIVQLRVAGGFQHPGAGLVGQLSPVHQTAISRL